MYDGSYVLALRDLDKGFISFTSWFEIPQCGNYCMRRKNWGTWLPINFAWGNAEFSVFPGFLAKILIICFHFSSIPEKKCLASRDLSFPEAREQVILNVLFSFHQSSSEICFSHHAQQIPAIGLYSIVLKKRSRLKSLVYQSLLSLFFIGETCWHNQRSNSRTEILRIVTRRHFLTDFAICLTLSWMEQCL